jgi:hypothetical protein
MAKQNVTNIYHVTGRQVKPYGFWKFILDAFMTLITGGGWLIWVLIRYLRTH